MSSMLAGAAAVLGTRALALVASLLTTIITARVLGPAGRGEYYFAVAAGALAVQFGTLGLHASNAYLVAQSTTRAAALLANSFWVSLVVGALGALFVIAGGAWSGGSPHAAASLYWIALYVPAGLFFQLATSIILGRGDTRSYNVAQLALAAVTTIAIAAAATMARTPAIFVAAFAGGNLAVAVAVLAFTSSGARSRWNFDAALFREGWSFAAKSFVVSVLGFLVLRTNVFLVQRFRGPEELGFYSVAMQFMDLISLAPASLAAVLFPALVKSQSAWSDTKRHAAIAVGTVGAACLVLAVLVDPVIRLVFGSSFAPARMSVLLLLPAAACSAATTIFSQYLAATGLPVSVIVAWAVSALVGLVSGLFLVPAFGANGASIGLSVACGAALALMAGLSFAHSRRTAVDHLRTA